MKLKIIILVLLLPLLAKARQSAPNILFIYMDDLGWTDVAAGSPFYETPNIDRFAKSGITFKQAYSCGPNCAPSRASLLTGLYTPRHGVFTVGTSERGDSTARKLIPIKNNTVLDTSFTTVAEELKAAGYTTGLIGKWQLGNDKHGTGPQQQGFDFVISGSPGTPTYFYPYDHKHAGLEQGAKGEYLTDRLTDEALHFIAQQRTQPFFLYLSYFAVHSPVEGKAALVEKYRHKKGTAWHNNPKYAAMLQSADEGVGRLLHALDSLHITGNTVVIFYSDNGGSGIATQQPPLRGAKGMLYEGGIRVPLFIRWPGKTTAGAVEETPVIGVDFYPTLLDIAGIRQPLNKTVDGISFLPLITQQKGFTREALYWHFPVYLEGYKADRFAREAFRTRPVSAIRAGDYKLLEFYEDHYVELYNIRNDISESRNLAAQEPATAKTLHDKLLAWKKKVGAPEPTTLNPYYKPVSNEK